MTVNEQDIEEEEVEEEIEEEPFEFGMASVKMADRGVAGKVKFSADVIKEEGFEEVDDD